MAARHISDHGGGVKGAGGGGRLTHPSLVDRPASGGICPRVHKHSSDGDEQVHPRVGQAPPRQSCKGIEATNKALEGG